MAIDWGSYPWQQIKIGVTVEGAQIAVKGDTFTIKEDLKPLGGRYRGADRAWLLPNTPQVFEGLKAVVAKHSGGGQSAPAAPLLSEDIRLRAQPAPSRSPASQPVPLRPPQPVGKASQQEPNAEGMTIGEFVAQVEGVLRQQFPHTIWLVGEIQNLGVRKTATYFQLAEPKGSSMTSTTAVSALIWANKSLMIRRTLGADAYDKIVAEGMQVRVQCQVRLYKDRGSLSLTVMAIDPAYSEGVLAIQRQKVLKALAAKGLAERNRRLRPPVVPLRIGLVSAADSRAINDFLHQLFQYGYPGDVIVHHASMQGDKTSPEVRKALTHLADPRLALDYIVITRGGGSASDLRFFDDEALGEAICRCPVPVIAAIGHHDDRSVAEEVAFRREKTPTAAAVFLVQSIGLVHDFLAKSIQQIGHEVRRHAMGHEDRLQVLAAKIKQGSTDRLARDQQRLASMHSGLSRTSQQILYRHLQRLQVLAADLKQASSACLVSNQRRLASLHSGFSHSSQQILHRHHQRLAQLTRRLGEGLSAFNFHHATTLRSLADGLWQTSLGSLTRQLTRLSRGGDRLKSLADRQLHAQQQQLTALEAQVAKNDPGEWRKMGLVRLTTTQGDIVRSLADVSEGERLATRLVDGALDVEVVGKRPKQP